METTPNPFVAGPGKNALTHGLITGGLLILFSLLTYALGMMENKAIGFVTFILLVGGMYYGTKTFRERQLNGFISYGRSFSSAFLIGLVASLVLSVYIYFFYKFFDPSMIEVMRHQAEQEILRRDPEITDEALNMALSWTERFTSPGWLAFFGFLTNLFVTAILALILSFFLKKEDATQSPMI